MRFEFLRLNLSHPNTIYHLTQICSPTASPNMPDKSLFLNFPESVFYVRSRWLLFFPSWRKSKLSFNGLVSPANTSSPQHPPDCILRNSSHRHSVAKLILKLTVKSTRIISMAQKYGLYNLFSSIWVYFLFNKWYKKLLLSSNL